MRGTKDPAINIQSFINRIPFAKEIGVSVVDARLGFVRLKLKPKPSLLNHFGTYQAGVVFTIFEIAGGALCATFLDLSKNFLITKSSEIRFNEATGSELFAEATLEVEDVSRVLSNLMTKKKMHLKIPVVVKSGTGEVIADGHNDYYLRVGIPQVFVQGRNMPQA